MPQYVLHARWREIPAIEVDAHQQLRPVSPEAPELKTSQPGFTAQALQWVTVAVLEGSTCTALCPAVPVYREMHLNGCHNKEGLKLACQV